MRAGLSASAIVLLGSLVTAAQPPVRSAPAGAYVDEIAAWRAARDASIRADDGWLTLVGLFWFDAGEQRLGSAAGNSFVLPTSAPPQVGTFLVRDGAVRFRPARGTDVRVGESSVKTETRIADDSTGTPDVLRFGSYSMLVIKRGSRLGLRVRDARAPGRQAFGGERWFPISEGWRIQARWVAYDEPRPTRIHNVVGDEYDLPSPGYAVFSVGGREIRLEPVLESPGAKELFFVFKDATSGRETYPAGRFLYGDLPRDGRVVLDFNKAHNPPCAFTPFATCPLPLPQNHVPVRIEAGALTYD